MASNTPISVRDSEWTPRQREVLDLLMRRFTNAQIASTLQISLDGAKWHVSEIITKLGVDSRDEAADYWRTRNGMQARLFRAVRSLAPGATWGRWLAVAAGTGVAVGFAAAIVLAWPSDDTAPPSNPDLPSTPTSIPQGGSGGRTVLSNGATDYDYIPALAYVAPGGQARLVDGSGAQLASLMTGCEGLGSAKQGDVLNGGLRWSADGSSAYCLTDSLSIRTAGSDGSGARIVFPAGGCEAILEIAISPDGKAIACRANASPSIPGIRIVTANGETVIPATMNQAAFSPSGTAIVVAGETIWDNPDKPTIGRGSWNVYSLDGTLLGTIKDAYVANPRSFAWTLDGSALAYSGVNGLTVVELENGWDVKHYGITGEGSPYVTWVLDDSAILVQDDSNTRLVKRSGDPVTLALGVNYRLGRVSPDGKTIVAPELPATPAAIDLVMVDLSSGKATTIAGSAFNGSGAGFGPQFTWAGDSSRVCWVTSPVGNVSAFCADIDDAKAFPVRAPVQVEPDVLGYGDYSVIWRAFSPDLQHVAYTTPGLADRSATQTLWISDLDGSNAVKVGEAQGVLPYEWQPDGVYRPNPTGF